jgi:NDP-sugar pyrophosphorylase family protein
VLNIVIPMAGRGSRFAKAGYILPKPLIPVLGQPMVELVTRNLASSKPHRFIFICQPEHESTYQLRARLHAIAPDCEIVFTDGVTEGAACSVLLAARLIDTSNPLLIANSDQYVDIDIDGFLQDAEHRRLDGSIMTMPADDPKWSFARLGASGLVEEVREKVVISHHATVGIYLFARGAEFVAAATNMIRRDERVKGEFYVAPVYNDLIGNGSEIGVYDVGDAMHGMGTPEDLLLFEQHVAANGLRCCGGPANHAAPIVRSPVYLFNKKPPSA